jgi:hypothetical protein
VRLHVAESVSESGAWPGMSIDVISVTPDTDGKSLRPTIGTAAGIHAIGACRTRSASRRHVKCGEPCCAVNAMVRLHL